MSNVRSNASVKKPTGGSTAKYFLRFVEAHQQNKRDIAELDISQGEKTFNIVRNSYDAYHAAHMARTTLLELPSQPVEARTKLNAVNKNTDEIIQKNLKENIHKQANIIKPQLDALEKHIASFRPALNDLSAKQIEILRKGKKETQDLKTLDEGFQEIEKKIDQTNIEKKLLEKQTDNLYGSVLSGLSETKRLEVQATTQTTNAIPTQHKKS